MDYSNIRRGQILREAVEAVAMKTRDEYDLERAATGPRNAVLSVTESYNLKNALNTIIERYGIDEVKEMIRFLEITGQAGS